MKAVKKGDTVRMLGFSSLYGKDKKVGKVIRITRAFIHVQTERDEKMGAYTSYPTKDFFKRLAEVM